MGISWEKRNLTLANKDAINPSIGASFVFRNLVYHYRYIVMKHPIVDIQLSILCPFPTLVNSTDWLFPRN